MKSRAKPHDENKRRQRAETRWEQESTSACADRNDDKYDFDALNHRDLESGRNRHTIPTSRELPLRAQRCAHLRVGFFFVMQGDDACCAKDGLTKPSHTEKEQQ